MSTQTPTTATMSVTELVNILEPLIRRIVREELTQIVIHKPEVFALKPGSPLYADMKAILRRKGRGTIKLRSHAEVWGE